MYEITNVALDHKYDYLRRKAPGLYMEPMIAGQRLRLRSKITISDADFERNATDIRIQRDKGVVVFRHLSEDAPKIAGSPSPEPPVEETAEAVTEPKSVVATEAVEAAPAEESEVLCELGEDDVLVEDDASFETKESSQSSRKRRRR